MLKPTLMVILVAVLGASCTEQSSNSAVAAVGETKGTPKEEEPQIDCSKGGGNTLEMNECMSRDLDVAEAKLQLYLATARERFVRGVNDEFNDDDAAAKKAAILEFDETQKSWVAFRDKHCNSVYYEWKGGSIRGIMYRGCMIQMTEIRTRLIWQEWLTYQDSTPPILPAPPTGFERSEKPDS
jgi:uncharacterized protein YecT (DUF1311 family)